MTRGSLLTALAIAAATAGGCKEPPAPPATTAAPTTAPAVTDVPPPPTHDGTRDLDPSLVNYFRLIERNQPGDTGTARVRLRNHLKEHASDGQAMFLFGLSYHREKRYGKAREHFEQAIGRAPGFPTTYYFYGWSLYYLGDLDLARRAFETHRGMQPDWGDTWYALGIIALEQERIDEAEDLLVQAIQLQQTDPLRVREVAKCYARLGDIYRMTRRLEEARTALEKAVELWPDHYEAHYRLSRVLRQMGEEEAADAADTAFREAKARVGVE